MHIETGDSVRPFERRAIHSALDLELGALIERAQAADDIFQPARFDERDDPTLLREIAGEFEEALAHGASGAPAVRMDGAWGVLMGAQPIEVYRRWIEKVGRGQG